MASYPLYSSAATITVGSVLAIKGGVITVPVSLSGSSGTPVAGAKFTITYNTQFLTYKNNIALPEIFIGINANVPGKLVLGNITTSFIPDGMFLNLVFDVAAVATTPQSSAVLLSIEEVVNPDGVAIPFQAVNGSVTAVKAGDCDQNGTTSIAEVQSSINAFLGLKPATSCIDYDANGTVAIGEVQKVINTFLGL